MTTLPSTNAPHEILDHVNKQDQIIGTVKRSLANQDPSYIHREVGIYIIDNQQRLLFQQRSHKKQVHPGYWSSSCAGHIISGQTPEDAAQQELQEELGFTTNLKFIKKDLVHQPNETHFTYWYLGAYNGQEINVNPHEVEQTKFLSLTELQDLLAKDNQITNADYQTAQQIWNGDYKLL